MLLGKRVFFDWWILGPHYRSGTGDFSGKSSRVLTSKEQNDLREQLEDIDILLTDKTVNVCQWGFWETDGPWGGIRSGISLGFKF